MYKELYINLESGNFEKASSIVFSDLKDELVGFIMKKAAINNKSEALTILIDSLYDIQTKIETKKFVYQNESAFKSYFKEACFFKVKEYKKEKIKYSKFVVSDKILEMQSTTDFEQNEMEDYENRYKENQRKEYKKIKKDYGLPLKANKNDSPIKNFAIFHKLSTKEQVIVLLKIVLKMPFKDIFDVIGGIYKIKSVDVCKTTYYRCRRKIKL